VGVSVVVWGKAPRGKENESNEGVREANDECDDDAPLDASLPPPFAMPMSNPTHSHIVHIHRHKKPFAVLGTMLLRACLSSASPSSLSKALPLHLGRAVVASAGSSSSHLGQQKQQRWCFATSNEYDIKKVGVVGLGLMGHGIGLVSAQAGYEVIAVEAQAAALEAGKKRMDASLTKLLSKAVEKGKMTKEAAEAEKKAVEGRITYSLDLAALKEVDLVVEAIVENLGRLGASFTVGGRVAGGSGWLGLLFFV